MVTRDAFGPGAKMAGDIAAARKEMAESIAAHRKHVAARWGSTPTPGPSASRDRAREMLKASKTRARALLDRQGSEESVTTVSAPAVDLDLEDCHTLELLLSHVRHSVVRVCFYNLKLFCPSLVDEYDDEVRDQVTANLAQLPRVRKELEAFFDEPLPAGRVSALFPAQHRDCLKALGELARLANDTRERLDQEVSRYTFAEKAPALIEAVMAPLAAMQESLDCRKSAMADVVKQALDLCSGPLEQAGITVETDIQATPRIFADETALLNGLCELLTNAAKYSEDDTVTVALRELHEEGYWVELSIRDNGRGMSAKELAACRERGFTSGGTGEGLPMVAQIVEQDHLGRLDIESAPGKGTCVTVRLPVKLDPNMLTAQGE